jgi:hypothetical protein
MSNQKKCHCFGINYCYICDPPSPRDKDLILQCTGCGEVNEQFSRCDIGDYCECGGHKNKIAIEDKYLKIYFERKNKDCIRCQTLQETINYLIERQERCDHNI